MIPTASPARCPAADRPDLVCAFGRLFRPGRDVTAPAAIFGAVISTAPVTCPRCAKATGGVK